MRILQVCPYYSPQMGGSPQVVNHISKELSKRGHQVTVLAGDYGINKAAFPDEAFTVVTIPTLFTRWGFYFTPGMFRWCQKHVRDYDVIHLHEVRTFQNIIVQWFAWHYKIPYVLSAHGTLPVIIQRQFLKRIFDLFFGHRILRSAKKLIAVSHEEENQYRHYGIERERIRMIYNGLDLEEFGYLPVQGEFRKKMGITDKSKIVLYLGRLHQRKGIDILIRSFSILQKNVDDTSVLIAGPDDGGFIQLKSLVDEMGLENQIRFTGPLYGREKLSAYVDADVLASPGVYEIFGLVPFEALMCGTPVIVSDDCGSGQLIYNAHAGYTVTYGDINALAESLRYVLLNPEEAYQKVAAGQKFIREYLDWKNIITEYDDLYHECIRQ